MNTRYFVFGFVTLAVGALCRYYGYSQMNPINFFKPTSPDSAVGGLAAGAAFSELGLALLILGAGTVLAVIVANLVRDTRQGA